MIKPLFSFTTINKHIQDRAIEFSKYQRGAAIAETIIVFPVLVILGMGIVHISLLAQAKSNLEYAALMAARIGSTTSLDFNAMEAEVKSRMIASDPEASPYTRVEFCVLQPTIEAFDDFGEPGDPAEGELKIPNDNLPYRSQSVGRDSGINIQDANILRLKVSYLYDTGVPLMNVTNMGKDKDDMGKIKDDTRAFDGVHTNMDGASGVESGKVGGANSNIHVTYGTVLNSEAIVVMQTPSVKKNSTSGNFKSNCN